MLGLGGGRIREWFASRDTLIVLLRDTGVADPPPEDGALRLRPLTKTDDDLYARAIGTDSPSTFRARLSETTQCYVVEDEGRVLHASWVTTSCAWTRELRSFVCGGPDDAYVYESFTRADARGRGVYPFALNEICRALATAHVGRLWVAVEAHNMPSLRAVGKAGFERAFEISYARRLGRLTLRLPEGVKSDTPAGPRPKKRRIWLTRDGAMHQWE